VKIIKTIIDHHILLLPFYKSKIIQNM